MQTGSAIYIDVDYFTVKEYITKAIALHWCKFEAK